MSVYFIPKDATWSYLILNDYDADPDLVRVFWSVFYKYSPKRITQSYYNSVVPDSVINEIFTSRGGCVVRT